jgi:hypothetical protein
MRLRTRKWGCALGITLLVPMAIMSATLVDQAAPRPMTPEDMLRTIPIYPGSRLVSFTSSDELVMDNMHADSAKAVYRVNGQPEPVMDYYAGKMVQDGWRRGLMLGYIPLDFTREGSAYSEVALDGQPPWIRIRDIEPTYYADVWVSEVLTSNHTLTEFYLETNTTLYFRYR